MKNEDVVYEYYIRENGYSNVIHISDYEEGFDLLECILTKHNRFSNAPRYVKASRNNVTRIKEIGSKP